jgi:hypothetical protein
VRATATLTAAQRKYFREDDYPASMQLARQAIAESRAAGVQQLVLSALRVLASAAIAAEDEDAFEEAAAELEAETESAGDPMAALLWLVFKAEVGMLLASSEEEWAEVAEIAREALGTAEEIGELPRLFRTGNLQLIHAASCPFRNSSMTSCGVRYPSPEWRRVLL